MSFPGFCRISFNARVDLSFADMSVIRERGGDRERGERGGREEGGRVKVCLLRALDFPFSTFRPTDKCAQVMSLSLLSLSQLHMKSPSLRASPSAPHTPPPSHPLLRWRWLKFVRTESGARSETVTNPSSSRSSRDPARTPVSLCRSLSVKTGRRVR